MKYSRYWTFNRKDEQKEAGEMKPLALFAPLATGGIAGTIIGTSIAQSMMRGNTQQKLSACLLVLAWTTIGAVSGFTLSLAR